MNNLFKKFGALFLFAFYLIIWIYTLGVTNKIGQGFEYLYTITKDVLTGLFGLIAAIIAIDSLTTWKIEINEGYIYELASKTLRLINELDFYAMQLCKMWVYFQPNESKLEIKLANKGNYRQYFNELREKYFETYACTTDIEVNWPNEYLTRFNTFLLICSNFLTCSDLIISRLEEDNSLLINLLDKGNIYTDFFAL